MTYVGNAVVQPTPNDVFGISPMPINTDPNSEG